MFSWICAKAGRAAIFGLIAGLGIGGAIGFGLGVYFLPILIAGPGLDQAAVQALATSAERRAAGSFAICSDQTRCIGVMVQL